MEEWCTIDNENGKTDAGNYMKEMLNYKNYVEIFITIATKLFQIKFLIAELIFS